MTLPVSQAFWAHTADALSVSKRSSRDGGSARVAFLGGTHRPAEPAAALEPRPGSDAGLRPAGRADPTRAPAALPRQPEVIDVEDWDIMFAAVKARLRHAVGEQLGKPPEVPGHSSALSASLVQAVVLDCVGALEQLDAALKHERSQRPTP